MNNRYCVIDGSTLPFDADGFQNGWHCCGEYYCSQECLDASFVASGTTWDEHYEDDGDCYWTAWHCNIDGVIYVAA